MLTGMKLDEVLRAALDFEGVLDDHVALAGSGERDHLVDQRARQRGLARAGPAANRNVLPAAGGVTEYLSLGFADYSIAHVIIERIEHLGRLAHGQAGTPRHRGQQSFEADAFDGQLAPRSDAQHWRPLRARRRRSRSGFPLGWPASKS